MATSSRKKRRSDMRFGPYVSSTPKSLSIARPAAQRPRKVKQPGTVKAQLLGKLGPGGYSKLVEDLREVTGE